MEEQVMALLQQLRLQLQAVEATSAELITFLEGERDPAVYYVLTVSDDTQPLDLDQLHSGQS